MPGERIMMDIEVCHQLSPSKDVLLEPLEGKQPRTVPLGLPQWQRAIHLSSSLPRCQHPLTNQHRVMTAWPFRPTRDITNKSRLLQLSP